MKRLMSFVVLFALFVGLFTSEVEAYLGKVNGSLTPGSGSYKTGDKFSAKVMLNTGSAKVSVVYMNLQLDTSKLKVTSVVANRSKFEGVYMEKEAGGVVSVYVTSSKSTADLPSGNIEVATINLEAVSSGSAGVSLKSYEITGPSSTSDYSYELVWQAASFTVNGVVATPTPIPGNGTDGILKFKMSYAGVTTASNCANNWPVSVTVIAGSQSKTYNDVKLTEVGNDGGKKVFAGEVLLAGFSAKKNIAVFLKGPKHIQVKYGKNLQDGFYNQPGGGISVETSAQATPVYDFTKYPITVGDITGPSGVQDGSVDGRDFSYVKTEANKRLEGNNMVADLNGNCKLESQDLALLMLAMKDKQSQLY